MNRTLQSALALTLLAAALALAGCPKTPTPASGATAAGAGLAGPAGGAAGSPAGGPAAPSAGPEAGAGGSGASAGPPRPGTLAGTGATAPALPAPGEYAEQRALAEIHFDFDRYEIRAEDRLVLQKNAEWLKAHRGAPLLIEGHADERGTNEYNLALGERRASAARDYLATLGIDRGRVTIISYGEERPLCPERHETCWSQNRRAHFLVRP